MESYLTFCVTTYNRFQQTINCIENVLNDVRINEVVCVDDCSTDGSYERLVDYFKGDDKVVFFKNDTNLDCYQNKAMAVCYATNKYCLIADSDNTFTKDYIDKLYQYEWDADTIFTPSFAAPHFDFRKYEGLTITKENVSEYIKKPMFEVMLNACNYFVHRDSYLEVWDDSVNPVTSDSIFQVYNWLNSGRKIFVVPGLSYQHSVHEGSHYRNNVAYTPAGFHQNILEKLADMK